MAFRLPGKFLGHFCISDQPKRGMRKLRYLCLHERAAAPFFQGCFFAAWFLMKAWQYNCAWWIYAAPSSFFGHRIVELDWISRFGRMEFQDLPSISRRKALKYVNFQATLLAHDSKFPTRVISQNIITYHLTISKFGEPSPVLCLSVAHVPPNIHDTTPKPLAGSDFSLGARSATPGAEARLQFFGHRCLEEGLR